MKSRKSVLLVEDDKDDQEFFISTLNAIKDAPLYDVVNNGKEALERLGNSDNLPALIFMDINMPLMNGMECLEEIQKNPRIKDIPVVILSTSAMQKEQASRLGAKAYLKKGWDDNLLRKQLEQILSIGFSGDSNIPPSS